MSDLSDPSCAATSALRPTLVESTAAHSASDLGYYRAYTMRGAVSQCLLQRVRVRIRYHWGGVLWAEYRQTYFEFFRFDGHESGIVDVHDFNVMRDGWRQSVILGLVKQHRCTSSVSPSGEPVLEVRKQFLLAPGSVHEAKPEQVPGGWFGLLDVGPEGPSRTILRIARGDGSWQQVDSLGACPVGYPVAGRGVFTANTGWRTFERFHYRFANLAGILRDRAEYRPARLSPIAIPPIA